MVSTRFPLPRTFLVAVMAIACRGAAKPEAPTTTGVANAPTPASASASASGAPVANPGASCHPMATFDGKDPARLGLEVCTEPATDDSEGELTITIRRVADKKVLWTDTADSVAQSHIVGEQDPPALQIVIVHEVEPSDENEDAEDAYYVVDLEYVDGAISEVNRFRDSGD